MTGGGESFTWNDDAGNYVRVQSSILHSINLLLSCILALVVTAISFFAFIFYGSWLGLKLS